ncbi:uncharacterized protein Dwil_GK13697, isoform C [Drosophila willistoni]|uniref:Uncharacterized protein, isoform C n=1 Tax=Drosophila willistoni TaxID=7260 RepID=B4NHM7_DROWI|nr:protein Gawky isoform X1 [Drosophila willistoni]XP_023036197.1 protein Gawky isoform X1 [Drosophila willistoni]EDW83596.2 uncharacterized protein Dwil_GK13697, isoform C [Drosophila willistoni]
MREALFSQDGWGCQHVNQDTNWEVPSSPEPANKDPSGPPMWKPSINNGTDLWESNLRNGGQPTAQQQVPKPSWGHTPSSNLGGTWGEDDDGADSSNVWTGGGGSAGAMTSAAGSGPGAAIVGVNPSGVNVGIGGSVGASGGGPQWGLTSTGNNSTGTSGGGALPVVTPGCGAGSGNISGGGGGAVAGGGTNAGSAGNGWGDPREIRPLPGGVGGGGGQMDIRNVDHRDAMRGAGGSSAPSGDPRDMRMIDPRDPIRGDPRGISGRLNGTSEMWGHHPQISHNQMQSINKMVGQVVGAAGSSVGVGSAPGPGGPGPGGPAGIGSAGVPGTGVSSNIGTQWGANQSVGGPKDISKQISSGWEEPSPPPQRRNIPNYDDGTSLWGQQPARVPGGGGGHWKDMSEPMNRNHLIRGQNQSVGIGIGGNVPVGGGNPNNPMTSVVGPQARLTSVGGVGVGGVPHKQDGGTMWVHPNNSGGGRNPVNVAGWGDDSHNVGVTGSVSVSGSNWQVDDKASANSWSDAPAAGVGGWGAKQSKLSTTNANSSGWSTGAVLGDGSELTSDWSSHAGIVGKPQQQQQKLAGLNVGVGVGVGGMVNMNVLNTDMIKQSKQYRILVENGFKKEDVERALVSANMNIEEAAEMLRANANSTLAMEGWRRHEESLGSYGDHSNPGGAGGFATGRYPVGGGAQPSMSFPPNNLMNAGGAGSSGVGGGGNNPNVSALQVQKYLSSQQGPHGVASSSASAVSVGFGQGSGNAAQTVNIAAANTNNQQPSGQQIRMLGQQIQLAIHSGFISNQILNQPLTQTTLNLLNQLLINIKNLQAAQSSLSRGGNANPMAVNVAIAKYKQQIQTLQNQINAQQAVYIKQQQQQQNLQPNSQQQQPPHPSAHLNSSGNDYLRGHDAIANLPGNFSELNLNKPTYTQGASNQQSRLNQWKLPVLEKDIAADSTDFSRAPGATKQNLSSNSNNMGPLGLQNDGTWSTGRNIGDGWPDPSDNENKDWSVAQPSTASASSAAATAYTDLVQEFEPGKPWKGSQIKSIEDDPSITPGSVARSPLSINSTPKDADIFANTGKSSPTDLPPLSLSSSTWSFNPNQNFPSWSDNSQQCATSELWTSPLNKTASRGPPPGLTSNANKSITGGPTGPGSGTATSSSTGPGNANGWLSSRGVSVSTTNTTWTGGNTSWSSSWLLLKNLTAQIDGPTLRTLCMQHGPLVSFHLYLNQGIALCKYATREESNKAQMTLNNCVLGNTTIFAESPNEAEVQNILQHLPQTPTSGNSGHTPSGGGGPSTGNGSSVGGASSASSSGASVSGSSNGNGGNASNGNNGNGGGNGGGGGNGSNNPNTSVANTNLLSTSTGSGSGSSNNSGGSNTTAGVGSGSSAAGSSSSLNGGASGNGTGGKNTSANNAVGVPNSNNSTWRQTTQNPALQGQSRPAGGREAADYDYISQFVCSIVDD